MKTLDLESVPRRVKMAVKLRDNIVRRRLKSGDGSPTFAQACGCEALPCVRE